MKKTHTHKHNRDDRVSPPLFVVDSINQMQLKQPFVCLLPKFLLKIKKKKIKNELFEYRYFVH